MNQIDFNKLPETIEEYHQALSYVAGEAAIAAVTQAVEMCAQVCDANKGMLNLGDILKANVKVNITGDNNG
jgi:hypothetical protein